MTKDAGKMVFDMLGFQYKPLEKFLLAKLDADNKAKYLKFSYMKRIALLDKLAGDMGL